MTWLLLALAGLWAGAQNALAGGGSFVTLPALILAGLDPRAANITSTVAIFPGQVVTGLAGRELVQGTSTLSFAQLLAITLAGGVVGALLLLATPSDVFGQLLPWLVLAATALFALGTWGRSFGQQPAASRTLGRVPTALLQLGTGVYGGYFGGGNGFLVLTVLTFAGLALRTAGSTKNMLVAGANGAAVLVFLFSGEVHWREALAVGTGAMFGGLAGAWALKRVNERALRIGVVVLGLALTIGLFAKL